MAPATSSVPLGLRADRFRAAGGVGVLTYSGDSCIEPTFDMGRHSVHAKDS